MKTHYESVFPLLAPDTANGGDDDDASTVGERFVWLIRTYTATQLVFVLSLQREEPAASFHPTMRAVLAASSQDDAAFDCWLRLEQRACERKLLALFAELRKVCREYKIALKPAAKGTYSFKFPHQGRALMTEDICASLAEHGFPLLKEQRVVPSSWPRVDVTKWIAKACALQDAEDEEEQPEQKQHTSKRLRTGNERCPIDPFDSDDQLGDGLCPRRPMNFGF